MNPGRLREPEGATIVELVAAMGVASLLLVLVMTGSIFVQGYLRSWKQKDAVCEELVFLQCQLEQSIRTSRKIEVVADTIRFVSMSLVTSAYTVHSGTVFKDGRRLTQSGMHVECINVDRYPPKPDSAAAARTSDENRGYRGCYRLLLVVSDRQGNNDTLSSIVRNEYEYYKYAEK
jgi:hypothetical protein